MNNTFADVHPYATSASERLLGVGMYNFSYNYCAAAEP